MSKVLLDTSVIIDFLRRRDKKQTLLYSLVKNNHQLFISMITHTELYASKSVWEKKNAQEELEGLLSGMQIMPLEEEISKNAGKIRAKYGVNLLDALVAATALVGNLELSTLNMKDFEKIDGLKFTS